MSEFPGSAPASYPPPPPGPGPYYPPPGPPTSTRTNGFAIASLVLGIIGAGLFGILSVIFGILALKQIRERGGKGRGLAITGFVLSGLWTLVLIVGIVLAVAYSAGRSTTGEINRAGSLTVDDLKVGDCADGVKDGVVITTVTARPCAEAHDAEVFSQFDLPPGTWPGVDAVSARAEERCTDEAAALLQNSPMIDRLSLFILYPPDADMWQKSRAASCLVVDIDGGKLTGRAAG